jgi:hypothetical protein
MGVSERGRVVIRRALFGLVLLGLAGVETELLFTGHYEDSWQLVPLFLAAVAAGAVVAHLAIGSSPTMWLVRGLMVLLVTAGGIGVVLHYRGNLEFQMEMDPTQSGWTLFRKVMNAKAPPPLAPGVLAQIGLLGLVATHRFVDSSSHDVLVQEP